MSSVLRKPRVLPGVAVTIVDGDGYERRILIHGEAHTVVVEVEVGADVIDGCVRSCARRQIAVLAEQLRLYPCFFVRS